MLQEQILPEHSLALLRQISPSLAEEGFYLAGGTALALRLGHRISVDLDFFKPQPFSPDQVADLLCEITGEDLKIIQQTSGSLCVFLANTKVELFHHPTPLLAPLELIDQISLCSLPDNVAMKLSALTNRGSKKDFVDLAEILRTESLTTILDWYSQKYPRTDPFMTIKSLSWFDDAENEPDPQFLRDQDWAGIKEFIHQRLAAFSS